MHRAANLCVVALAVALVTAGAGGVASAQTDLVTLTVTVVTQSGAQLGGVELTASWDGGSTSATTASNGKAFLDVPEGADVTIDVVAANYVRNHPLEVDDASQSEVEIQVAPKARATLTVVDGEGPVENARIQMIKDRRTAVQGSTDADGTFETGIIESGDYRVRVTKPGLFGHTETVGVSGETEHEITMERGFVTVTFQVTDDHFDPPKPVPSATVQVGDIGSVNTGANGVQRLSVPVNTNVVMTASKEGYRQVEARITTSESDRTVEIRMQRQPAIVIETLNQNVVAGERVLVTVTDEYGDPVADAQVLLDGSEVGTTDDAGEALVEVETVGNHTITARSGELTSEPRTVRGIQSGDGASPTAGGGDGDGPTTEPSPTDGELPFSPPLPGFGMGVAVVAILLAVIGGALRRR